MLKKFILLQSINTKICYRSMRQYPYLNSKKADTTAFCGSRTGNFFQEKPHLGNQYTQDPLLIPHLQRVLPLEVFENIKQDLVNFGDAVAGEVLVHHNNVCLYEPILQQYDAWGRRVDDIIMHPSWKALHDIAAKEGLVSIAYNNRYGEWSRLYQIVKLYLFSPASGLYSCPLAMTDGASSILKAKSNKPFSSAFKRLTSNAPDLFWTSGQWMTEKQGGSDVGNATETLAIPQNDGTHKLYGYKWFTSATDANMSLTLARIVGADGNVTVGSKGLTMFYLETRNSDGSLNGIKIEKLKEKLGTRQMPTAELILDGTTAYQLSDVGRGIASISPMLTVTRIHNSLSAVSSMRRLLNLSKDFFNKRIAFGQKLHNLPLHVQTLARLEVEQRGGFFLLMKVAHLIGLVENNKASDQETLLLRVLTPLMKLYTGKQAVSVASEGLESFGGHGYLEDTGLPVFLRDAQVLSIWEGTTNVLSMDVLRSIMKTNGEVLNAYFKDALSLLSYKHNSNNILNQTHQTLTKATQDLQRFSQICSTKDESYLTSAARDYSYSLARTYIGCLLYENAVHNDKDECSVYVAYRWSHLQDLVPVMKGDEYSIYDISSHQIDRAITYGNNAEEIPA